MSFQANISQLANSFVVLKQQVSQTNEAWQDPVQERFFEQFLNWLPKEFESIISELEKLNNSFERAEQNIKEIILTDTQLSE